MAIGTEVHGVLEGYCSSCSSRGLLWHEMNCFLWFSVFWRSLFFKAELELDELGFVVLSQFAQLLKTFVSQLPECSCCPTLELGRLQIKQFIAITTLIIAYR